MHPHRSKDLSNSSNISRSSNNRLQCTDNNRIEIRGPGNSTIPALGGKIRLHLEITVCSRHKCHHFSMPVLLGLNNNRCINSRLHQCISRLLRRRPHLKIMVSIMLLAKHVVRYTGLIFAPPLAGSASGARVLIILLKYAPLLLIREYRTAQSSDPGRMMMG